jgi:hypothetical protein
MVMVRKELEDLSISVWPDASAFIQLREELEQKIARLFSVQLSILGGLNVKEEQATKEEAS